jgi:hypothetical protein
MTEKADSEVELAPLRQVIGTDTKGVLALPLAIGQELLALVFASDPGGVPSLQRAGNRPNDCQPGIHRAKRRLYQSTVRTPSAHALNQSMRDWHGLDPEDLASIQRVGPHAGGLFVITLLDEEGQEVEATTSRIAIAACQVGGCSGRGLGSRVILSGAPLLLTDAKSLLELDGASLADGQASLSGIAVPMTIGSRVVGMLSARSHSPNAYTNEDLRLLATLANQAVVTIQNGRLFAETQRLAQELEQRVIERTAELRREQQSTETLLRILTEVSSSLDLDGLKSLFLCSTTPCGRSGHNHAPDS